MDPLAGLRPFLERWNLDFVSRPPLPGGREPYPGTGEVAFVRRGDEALVLKLLPAGEDEMRSGEVLAHWAGHGAVRLVDHAPGAVLIERVSPGDDLGAMALGGEDDAATLALCEVMEKLNCPPPPDASFRTIADWGRGFARYRPRAAEVGMDLALVDRGAALFEQLCLTQSQPVVLHGDLQHYNVLRDAARGWVAIDPKGVLGEPAYEPGAMLRNPNVAPAFCADPARLERRMRLICERLGYPYQRVAGWCFSQWVLSVLWALESGIAYSPAWLDGPRAAEALL